MQTVDESTMDDVITTIDFATLFSQEELKAKRAEEKDRRKKNRILSVENSHFLIYLICLLISIVLIAAYTEHYQNGVYKLTTVGTHRLGIYLTYKVEYNSDDGKWHAFINSVDKVSSSLATSEIKVQAKGEVHKQDIEMGPFSFSTVKVKNSSNTWVDNTTSPSADSPYTVSGSATSFTVSGP